MEIRLMMKTICCLPLILQQWVLEVKWLKEPSKEVIKKSTKCFSWYTAIKTTVLEFTKQ